MRKVIKQQLLVVLVSEPEGSERSGAMWDE